MMRRVVRVGGGSRITLKFKIYKRLLVGVSFLICIKFYGILKM